VSRRWLALAAMSDGDESFPAAPPCSIRITHLEHRNPITYPKATSFPVAGSTILFKHTVMVIGSLFFMRAFNDYDR
jgi:hypothetical protein